MDTHAICKYTKCAVRFRPSCDQLRKLATNPDVELFCSQVCARRRREEVKPFRTEELECADCGGLFKPTSHQVRRIKEGRLPCCSLRCAAVRRERGLFNLRGPAVPLGEIVLEKDGQTVRYLCCGGLMEYNAAKRHLRVTHKLPDREAVRTLQRARGYIGHGRPRNEPEDIDEIDEEACRTPCRADIVRSIVRECCREAWEKVYGSGSYVDPTRAKRAAMKDMPVSAFLAS